MKPSHSNLLHTLLDSREPGSIAFIVPTPGAAVTTAEWRSRVGRIASALASLEIGRESRVSFRLGKSLDAIALAHACLQVGAVVQPINPAYTEVETRYILDDVDPDLIVCEEAERQAVERIANGRRP